MLLFTNCKINVGLDVTARRADGYHEIATCMIPVQGLCDALELLPAPELTEPELTVTGLPVEGPAERNLCMRAWNVMHERHGTPAVRMHLHKVVPTGAGLGGGSADAAFVLRGIHTLFSLDLTDEELESLASEVGSDAAFFIRNTPAIATGRGETVTPFALPELSGKYLLIVKPPVAVGTAEAYAGITPALPAVPLQERLQRPLESWRTEVVNAFEPSVFTRYPELAAIKRQLYELGALYASMSGSGSALYGIFDVPVCRADFSENLFVYQEYML